MRQPLAIMATILIVAVATSSAQARPNSATWKQRTISSLRISIQHHRTMTWTYQDRAGVARTITKHRERATTSVPFLAWIKHLWVRRQARARLASRRYLAGVGGGIHRALWLCIHSREGAWNDAGAPYYGGLQMSYGWGGVARADLLSPSAQMALAERQYRASGYSTAWLQGQWPNTSPPCLGYA